MDLLWTYALVCIGMVPLLFIVVLIHLEAHYHETQSQAQSWEVSPDVHAFGRSNSPEEYEGSPDAGRHQVVDRALL